MDRLDWLIRDHAEAMAAEQHADHSAMMAIYRYHQDKFWEWMWQQYLSEQEQKKAPEAR